MKQSEWVCIAANIVRGPGAGQSFRPARTSTKWCGGDGMWNCAEAHTNNDGTVFGINNPKTYTRGTFTPFHYKDFGYISDGTSNTIGISEAVCSDATGDENGEMVNASTKVKGGVTGGTNPQIYYGGAVHADKCLTNAYSAADRNELISGAQVWRGQIFGDGRAINVMFHTVLPPNSPSCGYGAGSGGSGWGAFSATSHHMGGVNGAMMDGAVRFIPETIDVGDLTKDQGATQEGTGTQPVNSGGSHYGVWGALGTPAAGESASL